MKAQSLSAVGSRAAYPLNCLVDWEKWIKMNMEKR
jgi:hypothetical protein